MCEKWLYPGKHIQVWLKDSVVCNKYEMLKKKGKPKSFSTRVHKCNFKTASFAFQ